MPPPTWSATARRGRRVWSRRKPSIGTRCWPGPRTTLSAPLKLGQGVVHVAQPQASLDRLEAGARRPRRVQPGRAPCHDRADRLGACSRSPWRRQMSPEQAWAAAHVDEDWQIGQWGDDAEAAERRANRRRDFEAAAKLFKLINPPPKGGARCASRAGWGSSSGAYSHHGTTRTPTLPLAGGWLSRHLRDSRPCYAP